MVQAGNHTFHMYQPRRFREYRRA